jgi:signal transduction histidine kinase
MRLVPRSLFGRLVLILLGGLAVAQLVTLYLSASERNQIAFRSGGMQAAQRIADLAKLLDSMAPGERAKVAAVFDGPPLAITLDAPPLAADATAQGGDLQLAMFSTMLRFGLGDAMPATIVRAKGPPPQPPPRGWGWGRGRGRGPASMMDSPMMGRPMMGEEPWPPFAPGGANFAVQVRLHDGTPVTFDSYLAPEAADVPLRIALALLASLVTVIALSLVAVRWVTVPLRTLAVAAEKLGQDLDQPPMPVAGPLEVRQAASAFNTMQQRLAKSIAERTRLFTAMSHDLKTPITRMRLRAELLEDDAVRTRFTKDLDDMEAMVTHTLEYMRDATVREPVQAIDVAALLESLQNDYAESGGSVEIRGGTTRPYAGRPLALRRCLTNLIDNALRYGKRATVVVDDSPATLTLRVQDEGPGLPADQLERAFEPFFRGEASRSRDTGGTGLGLGIARNVARAHRGDLVLANRPQGGLEATLTLARDLAPAAASVS